MTSQTSRPPFDVTAPRRGASVSRRVAPMMRPVLNPVLRPILVVSVMLLSSGGHARAADPSASECLDASAASLRLDSLHRLRAERAELLICAALSCPADVRNECIRRVDDVNAAIPTIMFEVKDAAGNDLSAVKVSMDGQTLTDRLEGIALPIDPGAHLFTFEAGGQTLVRKHFVIREGEKRRRESIVLGTAASPAQHRASDESPSPPSPLDRAPATPQSPEKAPPHRAARPLSLIAAAAGVAGLGLGTVFGLRAMSKRDDARAACPGLCADQAGVTLWRDAARAGTVSTIAFAVGGAGVLGAAALWLASGTATPATPSVDVAVGPGTMALRGRW